MDSKGFEPFWNMSLVSFLFHELIVASSLAGGLIAFQTKCKPS